MGLSGSDYAHMESRFGVARFGATRFGYFGQKTYVTIGGEEFTDKLDWRDLEWIERLGAEPDTATVTLRGGPDYLLSAGRYVILTNDGSPILVANGLETPLEGTELKIAIGASDRTVFAGPIIRVERTNVTPDGDLTGLEYRITATDQSKLINRERVIAKYTSTSASTIISDIVTNWTTGFTTSNVTAGAATIDEISFKYVPVMEALKRVAERVGWHVYVDGDKDVHFFSQGGDTGQQATSLTEPISGFWDLEIEDSGAQVRTRAIVEGRGSTVDTAVTSSPASIHVEFGEPFQALLDGGYSGIAVIGTNEFTFTGVTFDNAPTNTGAADITGIPTSGAGSIVDDWTVSTEVNTIIKRNNSSEQTERAAIEGDDGVHEVFIRDRRLSPAGMAERGDQELDRWADTLTSGRYMTQDRHARAGRSVTINVPTGWDHGSATYTIQEQRTRWLSRDRIEREVTFAPVIRTLTQTLKDMKLQSLEAD